MPAELGHEPNRAYFSQAGNIHLNGATLYDGNEAVISGPGTGPGMRMIHGRSVTGSASDVIDTGLSKVTAVFIVEEHVPRPETPDHEKAERGSPEFEETEHGKPEHDKPEHGHDKPEHEKRGRHRGGRAAERTEETDAVTARCTVGNQAGNPPAGSILIESTQPAGDDDPTPVPAATFGKTVEWIAIGT